MTRDLLYGTLLLLLIFALIGLMIWDVFRQCAKANHELVVDELWDDEEEVATC